MELKGKVIVDNDLNIWPHERQTAEALANAGYVVKFVRKSEVDHVKTPDIFMDGLYWEFKSPKSGNVGMILKNLRRALHQSCCIVFDSRRMKNLPNQVIEREVRIRSNELRSLRRLIYINRRGEVVVIK